MFQEIPNIDNPPRTTLTMNKLIGDHLDSFLRPLNLAVGLPIAAGLFVSCETTSGTTSWNLKSAPVSEIDPVVQAAFSDVKGELLRTSATDSEATAARMDGRTMAWTSSIHYTYPPVVLGNGNQLLIQQRTVHRMRSETWIPGTQVWDHNLLYDHKIVESECVIDLNQCPNLGGAFQMPRDSSLGKGEFSPFDAESMNLDRPWGINFMDFDKKFTKMRTRLAGGKFANHAGVSPKMRGRPIPSEAWKPSPINIWNFKFETKAEAEAFRAAFNRLLDAVRKANASKP